jgi:hypothetical protein
MYVCVCVHGEENFMHKLFMVWFLGENKISKKCYTIELHITVPF